MVKTIYLIIALSFFSISDAAFIENSDACVTYNPKSGTYTVDASGCVDRPETKTGKESSASRDRSKSKENKKERRRGKNS